ncbi:ATP-binding cassette domain-containing protein [Pseudactinotalea sp. HY160]|nr:ABC transporter ATP-binding protein [Pseudactinotalea sp. HY160]MPV50659.1 ATP-binding cassette domain-containing protein [Pseudactinotalea sp. HY160]
MRNQALQVEGLNVSYGSKRAVRNVSLVVPTGVTGLLGPNGAGKSSILRTVATVQRADSGSVTFDGLDLIGSENLRSVRRLIGYLPQSPGLYPSFRVYRFVDHVALLKEIGDPSKRRTEVDRVLTAVDLFDRRNDRIARLSGGMRQRLALACTIVGAPELVILDEPTVGMDPEQRIRFRELVGRLAQQHVVLLSTHQTDDVSALCSQVAVMRRGEILYTGTPAGLASRAEGMVWESDVPDERALAAWKTGDGRARNVGNPPAGALIIPPSLDDGYLLITDSERAST